MNNNFKIREEELLLLQLCRLTLNETEIIKIRSLISIITDWGYFCYISNSHGVAALAYHNLEKHELLEGIKKEAVIFLHGALMHSLSRNTFNTESMSEVLHLLNESGIKTVLLKGLALELTVYGNAGLRQMSDVDILISRNQSMRARQILINNGYISLPVKSIFHKPIIAYMGKHLPSLIKNGTSVEIHHELFGGFGTGLTTMLYDNSIEIGLKREKVYVPRPQIFFLYLIKHLHLHELNNESQLRLYTDLVVLIEQHRDEIINRNLLALATEAGLNKILAEHLKPLIDFWGIAFPDWLNDFIDGLSDFDTNNKFIFFLKSPKNNPPLNQPGSYRDIIRNIPGIHRKFLYLLGDIFPSVSFMKNRYNCTATWKTFLYYPHRIGKIVWIIAR